MTIFSTLKWTTSLVIIGALVSCAQKPKLLPQPIKPKFTGLVHLTKNNTPDVAIDAGTGAKAGQKVKLWPVNTKNVNQQWEEFHVDADFYLYKKRGTEFCFDAGNGGEKGQKLTLQRCDSTNLNQHFMTTEVIKGNSITEIKRMFS